eukprot:SAG11_NODE_35596_length_265_cov_74.018072_1_plen_63_part_01
MTKMYLAGHRHACSVRKRLYQYWFACTDIFTQGECIRGKCALMQKTQGGRECVGGNECKESYV